MAEKRLALKTRDVAPFTQHALVGFALARLRPGQALRIHQFQYATSNGDEVIVSPYIRELMQRTLEDVIARAKVQATVRTEGLDLIVEMAGAEAT